MWQHIEIMGFFGFPLGFFYFLYYRNLLPHAAPCHFPADPPGLWIMRYEHTSHGRNRGTYEPRAGKTAVETSLPNCTRLHHTETVTDADAVGAVSSHKASHMNSLGGGGLGCPFTKFRSSQPTSRDGLKMHVSRGGSVRLLVLVLILPIPMMSM